MANASLNAEINNSSLMMSQFNDVPTSVSAGSTTSNVSLDLHLMNESKAKELGFSSKERHKLGALRKFGDAVPNWRDKLTKVSVQQAKSFFKEIKIDSQTGVPRVEITLHMVKPSNPVSTLVNSVPKEEKTPPSTQSRSYANAASSGVTSVISADEYKVISDRLMSVDLRTVAQQKQAGTPHDPMSSCREIPFYHNPDKGVYSVIEDIPCLVDIVSIILLILGSPGFPIKHLERIKFEDYKSRSNKCEVGSYAAIDKLVKELIIHLNLREDSSQYEVKESSKIMVSISKILIRNQAKAPSSINLTPAESLEIQRDLNVKSGTLVYKTILMLTDVLNRCLHATSEQNSIRNRIEKLVSGKNSAPIRRTLKDAGKIEPLHLYSIVLSSTERKWISDKCSENKEENIFTEFNRLSRKFRKGDVSSASSLQGFKKRMVEKLGNNTLTIIYGRLKVLGHFSTSYRNELYGANRTKRRLNYVKFLTFLHNKRENLSIFAEDNIFSTLNNYLTQSTVISPITEKIYWSLSEKRLKYVKEQITSVPIFNTLRVELKNFILLRCRVNRERSVSPIREEKEEEPQRRSNSSSGGKKKKK
jgi:hypothetical protein